MDAIIELKGVTKYYQRFKALDNLTVLVRPGAIGLLGPNGAGKSTLIKALLGLVQLSAGEVSVLGFDVRSGWRRIRECTGFMPEDDCSIAGLKGVQSVALAGELAGLPALTALRRAHEILDYVTLAEERYREVQTYSVGMRQKIKLAQALIHSPRLVFLDEPTTGLDPVGREKMLRLIRNLAQKKGVSVVLSTHILNDVEACCDSALILGRGRLLVYDTIQNLQRTIDSTYRVRLEGKTSAFLQILESLGCRGEVLGEDVIRVWSDRSDISRNVFRAARQCSVSIRQIEASRNSLEDIFLTAVRETVKPGKTEEREAWPNPPGE